MKSTKKARKKTKKTIQERTQKKTKEKLQESSQEKTQNKTEKKSDHRRWKWILMIVAVSVVLSLLIIPKMIYRINEGLVEQEAVVEDLDVSGFAEKTFAGSYSSGHMFVSVEVTVENGQYTDIQMTGYSGINPTRAGKVIQAILRYQTLTPEEGDIGQQFTDIMVQKAIYYAIRYNYSVNQ